MYDPRLLLQTATVGGLAMMLGMTVSAPAEAQTGQIAARARVLPTGPSEDGLSLTRSFVAARWVGRMERRLTTVRVSQERRKERRAPVVRVEIAYLRN
jgi:hypothetical protein